MRRKSLSFPGRGFEKTQPRLKIACPPLSVAVPSVVAPSAKVTVLVGVPDPLVGVTVAVKVTAWPNALGFGDELAARLLGQRFA
jgi:hypothetical protein